ncbi:FG-GAP repeat domain-containing protein [Streptomyces sp. NPDC055140]
MTVSTAQGPAADQSGRDERIGFVFGSAHGLDPATRAVYGRSDLRLSERTDPDYDQGDSLGVDSVRSADLDGDGFPDFVTTERAATGRSVTYVAWGSAHGPTGRPATPLVLPPGALVAAGDPLARGDFDGDGHLDLAIGGGSTSGPDTSPGHVRILFGPFSRAGAASRLRTLPDSSGIDLLAAPVDATDAHRATPLYLHHDDDGEQTAGTLYLNGSARGRETHVGNAFEFGDFDGDGTQDLAVSDSGSRNDAVEPEFRDEASQAFGGWFLYPGAGAAPVRHEERGLGGTPYLAMDPDGDSRDGYLAGSWATLTYVDGERRTPVARRMPARVDGQKVSKHSRYAMPVTAADFDRDGRQELVLVCSPDPGSSGVSYWWVTDVAARHDLMSFSTRDFAP